jgi:glycerol-3-phosphate O-acyltransferase
MRFISIAGLLFLALAPIVQWLPVAGAASTDGRNDNMLPALDFSGWTATLARKLLYAWVRPTVLPQNVAELAVDPGRPVCYVVQDRRLSNILVLIEETQRAGLPPALAPLQAGTASARHSFFCLTRKQRIAAAARDRYGHSPLMASLVEAAIGNPAIDVQIVPVTIIWGRSPRSQDSILKALFAESWRPPGHLRQLGAILLHGRHALVRFGAPLSLRAFVEDQDATRAQRRLSRLLRAHFRRQRLVAIGPDLSHRNTQVGALLAAPSVRRAIGDAVATQGLTHDQATAKAREMAWEIASDYSYGMIRALELFLEWLWMKLYDGIEVRNFERLDRIAQGSTIVYLPCHRSHIDYLLLSFVVYRRGLTPPHIAAGANLNLPLIGPMLRRGGAFFLRRSFKDQPLYAAVFHEYLHRLVSHGFPVEYFIEGGRSRSGRTLAPRTGLLGMTVRSYLRDHSRPLAFVPVYIGYEKLIEGASFVNELEGKPKRGESLWGLLRMARRIRREFGRVHVNFGEPLMLGELLDRQFPQWLPEAAATPEPQWVAAAVRTVADETVRRINAAAVVNPVNLVGLALLAAPKHCLDEAVLHRLIGHYAALLQTTTAIGDDLDSALSVVDHVRQLGLLERIDHPFGNLVRVVPEQAQLLSYFRNNVLHLFALPAVVACLISHNPCLERHRFDAAVAGIYGLLRRELFLSWTAGEIPAVVARLLDLLMARGLVRDSDGQLAAPEANSEEWAELRLIGEIVRPTLERHFLILTLLQRSGSGKLSRLDLERASHLLAQRLALLYEANIGEFAERASFSHLVSNLIGLDLLREDENGKLCFDAGITAPAEHAELLLPAELRQAVHRATAAHVGEPAAGDK